MSQGCRSKVVERTLREHNPAVAHLSHVTLDPVADVSHFVPNLVAGVSQMGWQSNNQLNCDTGVNL